MTQTPAQPSVVNAAERTLVGKGGTARDDSLRRQRFAESNEARRAATAARRAVIADRTKPTGYRIGTWVRTNTRSRAFDNRIGVVVTNNLGEVGLGFGTEWSIQLPQVDAWFLPTELTKLRAQGGHS